MNQAGGSCGRWLNRGTNRRALSGIGRLRWTAWLFVCAALFSTACASSLMRRGVVLAPKSEDFAYVCFVRPHWWASAVHFTVMDDRMRFLGEAQYQSHWTVQLEPGKHWFYSWGEGVSVVRADVLPGRTYYVLIRPGFGTFRARAELTAVRRDTEWWASLDQWLQESEPLLPDTAAGQAELDSAPDVRREKMLEAIDVWKSMNERERRVHTLLPEDGIPFRDELPASR